MRGACARAPLTGPVYGEAIVVSWGCTGNGVSWRNTSRGCIERESGGKEASRSRLASDVWSGLVPRILVELQKCKLARQASRSKQSGGKAEVWGRKPPTGHDSEEV